MKPPIKIFVCEFITGGGFNHDEFNASLLYEGQLMRDVLLEDLSKLPYKITTTYDARLAQPQYCDLAIKVNALVDVWQVWDELIKSVDAVWFVAPESAGILEKLTKLAEQQNKIVIGSNCSSIQMASNKLLTYEALKEANIPTLLTYDVDHWQAHNHHQWVAKPLDGAGCEDTYYFDDASTLDNWLLKDDRVHSHIVQAFQDGIPASISCLIFNGAAKVLACNKQLIYIENNSLFFKGVLVNGLQEFASSFEKIANQIALAFPGLEGYVGIDVIVSDSSQEQKVIVVEINPRLTTAYVALKEAIGINVAELWLNFKSEDTHDIQSFQWPELATKNIKLEINHQ